MAETTGGHGLARRIVVFGVAIPMVLFAPLILLMSLSTILVAMLQAQYGTTCGLTAGASSTTSWVAWARRIAEDDSHGYSQPHRNGNPDYDCSSLVYYALRQAGLDVGSYAFNTTGEGAALEKAGFERHDWTGVADLQAGDIVWNASHTEIYAGDGEFIGAHYDENGGIDGAKSGDQTGDEISVTSYAAGFTAYYRYRGSLNVTDGNGSASSAQAVSGNIGSANVVGMSESDAEAWYGGRQGPDDFCRTYAYGQCTWWTCMRARKIGWKNIGRYWGNGADWAGSAAKAGYRTTVDAPVAGAIISWRPGIQGADATYGHVGIVESVDTAKGTITTSEKSAGTKVYSRTLPIRNGGTYVLPNGSLTGMAASSTQQCVTGDDAASGVSGEKAGVEDAKRIAKRRLKDYGWGDDQYECLVNLWTRESSWRWDATNASSGAYGIPQALPASKMASAGQDWRTNAATQISWGLGYIAQRYQTPCGAWAPSESTGWY